MKNIKSVIALSIFSILASTQAIAGSENYKYCIDLAASGRAKSSNPNVNIGNKVWLGVNKSRQQWMDHHPVCQTAFIPPNSGCPPLTANDYQAWCAQWGWSTTRDNP